MSSEDLSGNSEKVAGHSSPSSIEAGLTSTIPLLYADLEPYNITGNSNFSHDIASFCQLPDIGDSFSLNPLEQNAVGNRSTGTHSQDILVLSDVMSGVPAGNAVHDQVYASSPGRSHPNYSSSNLVVGSSLQPPYYSASNVGEAGSNMCTPSSASSSPHSTVLLSQTGMDNTLFQDTFGNFLTPNSSFKDNSLYTLATSMATMDDRTKYSMTPSYLYRVSNSQNPSLQLKSERSDVSNPSECKVETTEEFLAEEDRINSPHGPGGFSNQLSLCSPVSSSSGVEYTSYGGGSGQLHFPSNSGPAVLVSPPNSTTVSPYRSGFTSQQSVQGGLTPSGHHSPLLRDGGESANVADDDAALPHHTSSSYHIVSGGGAVPIDLWNVSYTLQTKAHEDQLQLSPQVLRQQTPQQRQGGDNLQHQQHQQMLQQQLQQQMSSQQHSSPVQPSSGQHATPPTPPHLVPLPSGQYFSVQQQQPHQQPQASPVANQQYRYSVPHPYSHLMSPPAVPAPPMGQQYIVTSTSSPVPSPTIPHQEVAPTRGRKRKQPASTRMPAKQQRLVKETNANKGGVASSTLERRDILNNEADPDTGVVYYPRDVATRTYGDINVSPSGAYLDANSNHGSGASYTNSSVDGNDFTDFHVAQYDGNDGIDGNGNACDYEPKKAVKTIKKAAAAAADAAAGAPKKRGRPSSYKCGNCKQPYTTAALLRKHLVDCRTDDDFAGTVNGPMLLQCTVKSCPYDTYDKVAFENHMREHMELDGLTPTGRKRQSKNPLKRHRYNKEEIHCEECPYICTVEKAYLNHQELHDNGVKISLFASCQICGADLPAKSDIRPHINANHTIINPKDGEKHVMCDLCEFHSVQVKKLIQHRRLHSGEKPHNCPGCDYRAGRRDNLRSHFRRVHGADNIFADTYRPVAFLNARHGGRRRQQSSNLGVGLDNDALLQGDAMVMLGENSGLSITSDTLSFGEDHQQEQYSMGDPGFANINVSPLGDNYGDISGSTYNMQEQQKILMQPQPLGNSFSVWGESDSCNQGSGPSSSSC